MSQFLEKWHDAMENRDLTKLKALIRADAVFESPVVFSPQKGGDITFKYLASAMKVLANEQFKYVNKWTTENTNSAILEFESLLDGKYVNGVDMIWWDSNNQIVKFKVMVRPLQAMQSLQKAMAGQLSKM